MIQSGHTILYSQQQCTRGWSCSTFSIFVIVNVFDFSPFSWCVRAASYDFNLHLSSDKCIYTSFNVFICYSYVFIGSFFSRYFLVLKIQMVFLLIFICKNSLYPLDMRPLSNTCFANIVSQFVVHLFIS